LTQLEIFVPESQKLYIILSQSGDKTSIVLPTYLVRFNPCYLLADETYSFLTYNKNTNPSPELFTNYLP